MTKEKHELLFHLAIVVAQEQHELLLLVAIAIAII
jgi:hypothetical protein